MSDPFDLGVLYTDHRALGAVLPVLRRTILRRLDSAARFATLEASAARLLTARRGRRWPARPGLRSAHMINEFRDLAGAPPTLFFQPHDDTLDASRIQISGRPSEWLR